MKDDRHQRLADGTFPGLGHFAAYAAVGSHLAGRGRRLGKGLRVTRVQRGKSVGVLPNEVAHSASDNLEAVRVSAGWDQTEVARRKHLKDLRKRDLLQRQ